ncbi:IclR family transcriptional regulator [Ruania alkalisoli]|uniref:Glycerol operon regulatory protein n=1 Tax=Ruania alkalisoli TaxID=2779775 RepID=A0A7M1SSP0_9MICO|nr:IclR family transcriptional regulator [Ruania alkalisoli]QOR70471.1 IclR family transcriptional regulator [Ruania alkalisoli]
MPGSIQSIERAAAIVRLLAAGPRPLRLSEIATALQLPRGTAHGILKTLTEVDFVAQDRSTGLYELSDGLRHLGSGYLDANELRVRSMNWADPLATRTGTAVRVATLDQGGVLVVHYVLGPDAASDQGPDVGTYLPPHATALGQVLLAYSASAEQYTGTRPTAFTSSTIVDARALATVLTHTRTRGYAVERSQYAPERASIAAPIFGYGGLVVAAVGIHGEADRLTTSTGEAHQRLATHVCRCARSITRALQISRSET